MSFIYPSVSSRIENRGLQGREQLDLSRAAANRTIVT